MNQKRNSGFTLIELLAVIVILAIIALIAVPIIMNIISKANKSAFKDTAYGIISAGELYYAEQQLEPNGMLEDITIQLPDETKTLQLKGEVPTGSILITKEGKVAIAVHNNRYCVTKGIEDKDVIITENYDECELILPEKKLSELATTSTEVTSIPACLNDGTECALGTPVAIKVNASEVYNFYVIDETDSEVTLIMDRNIGNKVAWYKDDDDSTNNEKTNLGPVTALNYLNSQTSMWSNIPTIENYIYDNNLNGDTKTGYQKFEITNGVGVLTSEDGSVKTTVEGTSRARMLTYEEYSILVTENGEVPPTWLYTNLSDSTTKGYWLLTSSNASFIGYDVFYNGFVFGMSSVYLETTSGIRPVITLTK